ncbi:Alpha-mannosidase I MNS5 [Bienertia sinuspersici]
MSIHHFRTWVIIVFLVSATLLKLSLSDPDSHLLRKKVLMREKVRRMFYHAYDNYMKYAFPHDELKPLTKTFTDSLSELGNLRLEHLPKNYNGSALTLIESLSSLLILGNNTEFERAVSWLSENLTFDVDARVNLFECNIRALGGLVSAHMLATDSRNRFIQGTYKNELLTIAEDLGQRFLPAFNTPTGLPYAWINLKYGVMDNETTETSTSGSGSLILEMGALSRLTGDPQYEAAALRALRKLWSLRSPLNLLGTTLDVMTGNWIEYSSGIGAVFSQSLRSLREGGVLEDVSVCICCCPKIFQTWSMVLVGDVAAANSSHREFFKVWERFGVLPERYLLDHQMLHPTEKYYPLRPELAESTFYLYQATKDPWYLEVGEFITDSLNLHTKVKGGFASVRDVSTMVLEDHQHSFFLSETCKYLYLLYDDSFLLNQNYIFTTEGHPLPVLAAWHDRLPEVYTTANYTFIQSINKPRRASAMSLQLCPAMTVNSCRQTNEKIESVCHIADARSDHRCLADEDCGVDATTCRRRSCSIASFCGLWLFV